MSTYNPPTLEQLALEALLRNDAIDFSDLEYLPTMLFPPLFLEAFNSRHTEMLKAAVAAWPFSYLPVGPLLKTADVEMMQAVLDGIDLLMTQNDRPRKRKLQMLDLRDVHEEFWDAWAVRDEVCSPDALKKKQGPESLPTYAMTKQLQVVTNLSLFFSLEEDQKCLLQWAQKCRDSLQLICLKMKICLFPLEIIEEVLNIFQPIYIEELEICTHEVLSFLSFFPHFLGEMRNIIKFKLHQIDFQHDVLDTVTDVKKCSAKFFSQFSKLNHLQSLYLNGAYFSYDNMKTLFRCLKTPLESFSMSFCQLSTSDLKHMSKCQSLYQLKQLHFNTVVFSKSCFKSLRILLENVSETLQSLQLEHCRMKDSQLKVLLPALSQCSQLNSIIFYDNDFSSPVLKDLLQCMANLSNLTVEVYPAPKECYNPLGYVVVDIFSQLCPQLVQILMAKRQPKTIMFATATCPRCWKYCVYDMEIRLCLCWQEIEDLFCMLRNEI
ncbi:PRAME family member 12-like [Arvicanthis niloticus]|uniref:PRAME family member 12-like n=1 Tax=Arvicanthis niloticus TaxID=61156 RepID=UPI0014871F9C|nr:PRAME family member 12-like [Arvicanthis niloticus]